MSDGGSVKKDLTERQRAELDEWLEGWRWITVHRAVWRGGGLRGSNYHDAVQRKEELRLLEREAFAIATNTAKGNKLPVDKLRELITKLKDFDRRWAIYEAVEELRGEGQPRAVLLNLASLLHRDQGIVDEALDAFVGSPAARARAAVAVVAGVTDKRIEGIETEIRGLLKG